MYYFVYFIPPFAHKRWSPNDRANDSQRRIWDSSSFKPWNSTLASDQGLEHQGSSRCIGIMVSSSPNSYLVRQCSRPIGVNFEFQKTKKQPRAVSGDYFVSTRVEHVSLDPASCEVGERNRRVPPEGG